MADLMRVLLPPARQSVTVAARPSAAAPVQAVRVSAGDTALQYRAPDGSQHAVYLRGEVAAARWAGALGALAAPDPVSALAVRFASRRQREAVLREIRDILGASVVPDTVLGV